MKRSIRAYLASILVVLTILFTGIPVSAAQQCEAEVSVEAVDWVEQTSEQAQQILSSASITGLRRLTKKEIEAISDKLCEQSNVYLVELDDGRYTYYMAVDFRMEDGEYFAKLPVMRKTSHKLFDRTEKLADEEDADKSPVLMDYIHIVGELGAHYFVYRITNSLGGETLKGLLGKLYRSSVVADLNIDEERFPVLVRILGLLIGN